MKEKIGPNTGPHCKAEAEVLPGNGGEANPKEQGRRIPPNIGEPIEQLAETFPRAEAVSPYKPEDMWIDPELIHHGGAVKKLLTTIPLRKPNKHEFFRIHPGPEYWRVMAFLELSRGDTYPIRPDIVPHLDPVDFFYAYLCLAITRQGTLFFWTLKISTEDRRNSWNESALVVAKAAIDNWLKLKSRQEEGAGGGFYEAEIALGNFPEPQWPSMTQAEVYQIAFKGGRIIDNLEHPALQKLSGAI